MSAIEFKKEVVKKVEDMIKSSPIVGIVNVENLPMAQLQRMRKKLKDNVTIFMAKKRLIRLALENLKKEKEGVEQLEPYLKGMPAIMITSENPFKLYSLIQKNKSKAAAKAGQEAPNDIVVSAGPTSFAPGPIISELGSFGLKTKVNAGKIEITEDKVVAKEGEVISADLAGFLVKMGIEPMEVGLDLKAVYEGGSVFTKDVLAIDEDEYFNNFTKAHQWAFNLAVEASIFTNETTELLLQKAFKESKAVALEGNILTDATTEEILGKAEREMNSVSENVDFSKVPEVKAEESAAAEETKEEVKVEENKEESKDEAAEEAEEKSEEVKE